MKKDEYFVALDKVLKIRSERKKIYGDSWKESGFESNYYQILNKAGRLKVLVESKKRNNYENIEDTLIDLCNYCLFAITTQKK